MEKSQTELGGNEGVRTSVKFNTTARRRDNPSKVRFADNVKSPRSRQKQEDSERAMMARSLANKVQEIAMSRTHGRQASDVYKSVPVALSDRDRANSLKTTSARDSIPSAQSSVPARDAEDDELIQYESSERVDTGNLDTTGKLTILDSNLADARHPYETQRQLNPRIRIPNKLKR